MQKPLGLGRVHHPTSGVAALHTFLSWWALMALQKSLTHHGFDVMGDLSDTAGPTWLSIFHQGGWGSSTIRPAIGWLLYPEGCKERFPQLIPFLSHHHALIGNKLSAIHCPVNFKFGPQEFQEALQVLIQVELARVESNPKRKAMMLSSWDTHCVVWRMGLWKHWVSTVEASHWEDYVKLFVDLAHISKPRAIQNSLHCPVEHICESWEEWLCPWCPNVFRRAEDKYNTIATLRKFFHGASNPNAFYCEISTVSHFREVFVKPMTWHCGHFLEKMILP